MNATIQAWTPEGAEIIKAKLAEKKAAQTVEKGDQGQDKALVLDYRKPLDAAKEFSTVGQKKIYWQGCLYEFTGTHYQEKTPMTLRLHYIISLMVPVY